MLFVVEERLEGLKCNIGLGGGVGVRGEGLDMSITQKGSPFMEVPLHFCPSIPQYKYVKAMTAFTYLY